MSGRRRSSLVSVNRDQNDGVLRVKDESIRRLSQAHNGIAHEQEEAKLATAQEKAMTVRQAVRLYKKAICFSLAMSLAVVMEG